MIYECKCCRYVTDKKSSYDNHLTSKKHKKNNIEPPKESDYEKVKKEIRQPIPGRTDMVINADQMMRLGYNKEKVLNELREEIITPMTHIEFKEDVSLIDQVLMSYYVMSCLEEYDDEKFKYIVKYNMGFIAVLFDRYNEAKDETKNVYENMAEHLAVYRKRAIMAELEVEHLNNQIEKAKASRNQTG
jgi:hypothetical protein